VLGSDIRGAERVGRRASEGVDVKGWVVAHLLEDEGEVWKRCSEFEERMERRSFVRAWLWLGHCYRVPCTERL